jgi:hypothetical protein
MEGRGEPADSQGRGPPFRAEKSEFGLPAKQPVDPDPPAKVGQVGAASHAHVLAVVDQFAGGGVRERAGTAAEPGSALEQADPDTSTGQAGGGGQPGKSTTDDHDMGRGGWHHR